MNRKKKGLLQIGIGVLMLVVALFAYWVRPRGEQPLVTNFDECAEAGNPIMESYPRQCRTPDGHSFREDIGNELEKDDLIRISEPRPNTSVKSPLSVKGMARGNWFFEASFPIKLYDGNGEQIGHGLATAVTDWMTTEFVPFEAELTFVAPTTSIGTLLLNKDNPSGLPENEDALRVPITFGKVATAVLPITKVCVISGCSGQICSEEEMMSTCEFKEEYACYKIARCERQTTGKCGWTETAELQTCLDSAH